MNNRRLIVEEKLQNCPSVQFFFSAMSGYKNPADGANRFWVGFFVTYVEDDCVAGDFLFNAMHDAGLQVMNEKGKKQTMIDRLALVLKDHDNACVQVSYPHKFFILFQFLDSFSRH